MITLDQTLSRHGTTSDLRRLHLQTSGLTPPPPSAQTSSSSPNNSNAIHIQISISPAIYLISRLHLKRYYLDLVLPWNERLLLSGILDLGGGCMVRLWVVSSGSTPNSHNQGDLHGHGTLKLTRYQRNP
jgi:hypothetical protein